MKTRAYYKIVVSVFWLIFLFFPIWNQSHHNNLYYIVDGTQPNPCGIQLGKGSIIADPLFIDLQNRDFHLKASSPAIDAGVNLSYKKDFDDNPIPSGKASDMGIYEYQKD